MDEIKSGLSEAEREALRVLWSGGPGTVRQVMELVQGQGRKWVYSTVATLLRRLEGKGYAASESVGGSLVYRAAVSREDLIERRLKDTAAELCEGAAAPLVLALVQGNRFTPEELESIRGLIEAAKGEQPGPKKSRK